MRIRPTFLPLLSILILAPILTIHLSSASVPAFSAWSSTPPTVDGAIGVTEWSAASKLEYVSDDGVGGVIYVMNDATSLYLAITTNDTTLSVGTTDTDTEWFYFDNNNDGVGPAAGDDILLWSGYQSEGFVDGYSQGTYSFHEDTDDGGTEDGTAAAINNGTHNFFEIRHSLNSADNAHDFSLTFGDTIGFGVRFTVDGSNAGWWPSDSPASWAKITVASLPPTTTTTTTTTTTSTTTTTTTPTTSTTTTTMPATTSTSSTSTTVSTTTTLATTTTTIPSGQIDTTLIVLIVVVALLIIIIAILFRRR